ncbi:hypothetical protein NC651_005074 [Populus alba x Populus x berolinensis]|nr:hypothetical protein NC651_005074 [Populus alba x Populus x berolinensis]
MHATSWFASCQYYCTMPTREATYKTRKKIGQIFFLPSSYHSRKELCKAITNPVSYVLAVDSTLNFHFSANSVEMQGLVQGVRSCQETLRVAILRHPHLRDIIERRKIVSHSGCVTSSPPVGEKGLENLTVADVLVTKGEEKVGSWLWCRTTDTVYDAVKNMAQNNIGSLVVLGERELIAGIITERGT